MFLPYGTDAPIYFWPKATVGLIVANVVAFVVTAGMSPEQRMTFALSHGHGLHPVEWVTGIFVHANVEHLVGNMIFLWAFGIVVEGKLGVLKFLAVYLGIGAMQSAFEQGFAIGLDDGYSLGASAAIYGLLAICMVWAPSNELNCLWFWRFFPHQVDVAILWFALLYLGREFLMAALSGGQIVSAVLHLSGAGLGFVVGTVMLKAGLVDCENWDLFAVVQGRKGRSKATANRRKTRGAPATADGTTRKPKKKAAAPGAESGEEPSAAASRRLRRHLESGDALAAQTAYDRSLRTVPGWHPDGPDWLALIKILINARETRAAAAVMEDYLRRADDPSPRVRLILAQVVLREQRPAHALRILNGFPPGPLPASLERTRRQIAEEAERLQNEGVLELDGESW